MFIVGLCRERDSLIIGRAYTLFLLSMVVGDRSLTHIFALFVGQASFFGSVHQT